MVEAKKKFVKVCPNCLSSNLNVRIFDMGSFYDCKDCGLREFYPWEFEEKDLARLRAERQKGSKSKKRISKK